MTSSLVLDCFDSESGRTFPLLPQRPRCCLVRKRRHIAIMERTPSPPRRVHTPPAPFHGDNYEPFSPRRSSRVAAQRDTHPHHEQSSPRTRRDITPTASSKRSVARPSYFGLSPPSSPTSPQQLRSPRSTRRAPLDFNPLDSDSDHVAPTPARRFLSAMPSVSRSESRLVAVASNTIVKHSCVASQILKTYDSYLSHYSYSC